MAQIMKIKEFVKEYGEELNDRNMLKKLLALKPGESYVIAFGKTRREDVVFVRVTEHHMATMSVYEFNGIS